MMGSLELGPEADVSQLEPLLTLEDIEQLEATFVSKVRVSSWGPGPEKLSRRLCDCVCRVTWLPVSSRVSAPAAFCRPLSLPLGQCGAVAAEGTGRGSGGMGPGAAA